MNTLLSPVPTVSSLSRPDVSPPIWRPLEGCFVLPPTVTRLRSAPSNPWPHVEDKKSARSPMASTAAASAGLSPSVEDEQEEEEAERRRRIARLTWRAAPRPLWSLEEALEEEEEAAARTKALEKIHFSSSTALRCRAISTPPPPISSRGLEESTVRSSSRRTASTPSHSQQGDAKRRSGNHHHHHALPSSSSSSSFSFDLNRGKSPTNENKSKTSSSSNEIIIDIDSGASSQASSVSEPIEEELLRGRKRAASRRANNNTAANFIGMRDDAAASLECNGSSRGTRREREGERGKKEDDSEIKRGRGVERRKSKFSSSSSPLEAAAAAVSSAVLTASPLLTEPSRKKIRSEEAGSRLKRTKQTTIFDYLSRAS